MIVGIRVRPNILLRYEAPGQEPYTYWVNDGFLDFKVIGRGPCLSRRTVLSVEEIPRTPIREKTIGQKLGRASSWGMIEAWFAIQGPGR